MCHLAVLVSGLVLSLGMQDPTPASPQATRRFGRALLFGASRYATLEPILRAAGKEGQFEQRVRLHGPPNDVQDMRLVCIDVLGMRPEDIELFADENPEDGVVPAGPATRANLEAAFRRLADKTEAEELVVIVLAGHGSQIPDQQGQEADEADGQDEVFLPTDVTTYEQAKGRCANAVLDDELAGWITPILTKRARVWLLVDACHSATMARGDEVDEDRTRFLDPTLLGVPSVDSQDGRAVPTPHVAAGVLDPLQFANFVGFYAVGADQLERERRWPGCKRPMGLLTWQVARQLRRCGAGISFAELQRMVGAGYATTAYAFLRPVVEGELGRSIVDGAPTGWRLSLSLQDSPQGHELVLDSGAIQGLHPGDTVDVFASGRRGDRDAHLGSVRVLTVEALSATCEPTGAHPLDPSVLKGVHMLPAQLATMSAESRRLRVACIGEDGHRLANDQLPQGLHPDVVRASGLAKLVTFVDPDRAECTVRFDTRGGVQVRCDATQLFGAAAQGGEHLHRLAAARVVRSFPDLLGGTGVESCVEWQFQVCRGGDDWPANETEDANRDLRLTSGAVVEPGDRVRLRYRSNGGADCSLWWFGIDAAEEVTSFGKAIVDKKDTRARTLPEKGLGFVDTTAGVESMLVVVAPPDADLSFLETARRRNAQRGSDPASQLLFDLRDNRDGTRGPPLNGTNLGATIVTYRMQSHAPIVLDPARIDVGTPLPDASATPAVSSSASVPDLWSRRGSLSFGRSTDGKVEWAQVVERAADDRMERLRRYYDLDANAGFADAAAVARAFASGEAERLDVEVMIEFAPAADGSLLPVRTAFDIDALPGFDRIHADIDDAGVAALVLVCVDGAWRASWERKPWLVLKDVKIPRIFGSQLAGLRAALAAPR